MKSVLLQVNIRITPFSLFLVIFLSILLFSSIVHSQSILIKNADIHTLTSKGTLKTSDILIKGKTIANIGKNLTSKADIIIDAKGKQITPGVMAVNTQLGVTEIGAIKQTNDGSTEDKMYGASFKLSEIINPNSTLIPENRRGGVTRALIRPGAKHNLYSGKASIISLTGNADSVLLEDVAMYAIFGESGAQLSGESRASALLRLKTSLAETREYISNRKAIQRGDWRQLSLPLNDLQALIPVLKKRMPLVIKAHRASDIRALIRFAKQENIKMVINGGAEAWMLASELAKAKIPVIIDPINNIPGSFERLGNRLDASAILNKAGVKLIFSSANSHNAYLVRHAAGKAIANGLNKKAALKAVITHPAEIFGGAKNYGKIEKGYLAELVIWDGDPFEVTTNADHIIINGKLYRPVSRSTRLRDRYKNIFQQKLNPAYIK